MASDGRTWDLGAIGHAIDDVLVVDSSLANDKALADNKTTPPPHDVKALRNAVPEDAANASHTKGARVSVTELVKQIGVNAPGLTFDNTYVVNDGDVHFRLGIAMLPCVPFKRPNGVSPSHDHFVTGIAMVSGLGIVVDNTETPLASALPDGRRLIGIPDAIGSKDGRPVIVEIKTSATLGTDVWYKDVMRRTYIQQAMLYAWMLERNYAMKPCECIIVCGPSPRCQAASGSLYRFSVAYNPRLWLYDINAHLDCFCRYDGSPAPPCTPLALGAVDDEDNDGGGDSFDATTDDATAQDDAAAAAAQDGVPIAQDDDAATVAGCPTCASGGALLDAAAQ